MMLLQVMLLYILQIKHMKGPFWTEVREYLWHNEKATPAMFMPLDIREKENKYIVGIDRLTRYNVRVVIGEFVTISKTNGIAADKITKNRW